MDGATGTVIDFDAEYQHREKRFDVIVSKPHWWHLTGRDSHKAEWVVVTKLGFVGAGPSEWMIPQDTFERLYERKLR